MNNEREYFGYDKQTLQSKLTKQVEKYEKFNEPNGSTNLMGKPNDQTCWTNYAI